MWSFGTTMTMAKDREPSHASAQDQPLQSSRPSQPLQNTITPPEPRPSIFSQRSLKQLGLFFAGAGFLTLSTLITRRAVVRKRIATIPKFYNQSNRTVDKMQSDSSLIALEALNLATLNVMGFGIMVTGGLSWAFDVSNIDDLRRMARGHIGPDGGRTDEEAEREVEEWVAKVLLRKEPKEQEAKPPPKKDG
ncbi:uncharacterized protein F4822DRAFT_132977 [Hypoxylon trugodes]|uniref:uncharacterized protein n=1 Tax=Hypoxylon trugodes TaxID=326681 RepID=UPI0021911544|nr:uncharacterized protein F4822DRAFT_132977 [Hypoxylon trugodes]KAI1392575.1 hypothetical protein F4822DRAFT_132977 [Hypoxylon trugodes]